jgi:N-methylhydantoinase A
VSEIRAIRVGVDTGGTFTDVVVYGPDGLRSFKVPSTPDDPSRAILAALDLVLEAQTVPGTHLDVVHGTTVGTNTLLERTGARVAFVTNEGFEDVLTIGRQARPRLYDLSVTRPEPLAARERCFGVAGRIGPSGEVVRSLDPSKLDELARAVAASGAEAVALCLLFSFAHPEHERLVEARLEAAGLPVSASSRILPEYREYERAATTTVNAYLVPRMRAYLDRLRHSVDERGVGVLRVMQSSGGSISAETAGREPVRTILSGPAGGAVAASHLAGYASLGDLVTFDMGGTSTDVALVAGGAVRVTNETQVAGLPVAVPVIDIHTVGAGGGSIAYVDDGGALRVGPESAGADPGPACYGRGERPTVTDANLVLGRLAGGLLGGAMALDAERARGAVARLARDVSAAAGREFSIEETALGIVRVACANMERALRVVSVERGYDPRAASLLSFGGAGGLHACALADSLGMVRVVVPPMPGAFSALGLLLGDVVRDASRTVIGAVATPEDAEPIFAALETESRAAMEAEGVARDLVELQRSVALRYKGQSFELDVPWNDDVIAAFHGAHLARYGHSDEDRTVELVHVRVRAIGRLERPQLDRVIEFTRFEAEPVGRESVWLDDGLETVPRYERELLAAGASASGPSLVTEYGSTTLVPRGWGFEVDALGNLIISSR